MPATALETSTADLKLPQLDYDFLAPQRIVFGWGRREEVGPLAATLGRRAANATFFDSHATDTATQVIFGMDLTPLVTDESKGIVRFVNEHLDRFAADVKARLRRRLG